MQTILGAGGAIGKELAKSLTEYTKDIRLVSRNPEKVNETDLLYSADLTNPDEVRKAVEGSEIAYLTVGLTYKYSIWKETWPKIMGNVINACKEHHCKLVFFDNVYMYDKDSLANITEDNPINPPGKKGQIRAQIAEMLMDADQSGEIDALIARAADFYGPSINKVSVLTETVFIPLSKGEKAQCIGNLDKLHSYTYTPDAGKATALLGNTPDAYGQVWHLPTSSEKWTTRDFINKVADDFGVQPKSQAANKFMVQVLGLFIPLMKELVEMYYQYDRDYFFNSEKFDTKFNFTPTSYEEGIKHVIEFDYKGKS